MIMRKWVKRPPVIPAVCAVTVCITIIAGLIYFFFANKKMEDFQEIKNGNFSVIDGMEEGELNELETIYQNQKEGGDMEWELFDLNHDGGNELIWREKDSPSTYMRRIVAIFGKTEGKYRLILLDTVDHTEYYALENKNLIYYWQYFWLYQYGSFKKCSMNKEFEIEEDKELEVFIIPSYDFLAGETDEEWVSSLTKQYPFISGEGNYFRLTTYGEDEKKEKMLTEREWMQELQSVTGTSLERSSIDLYDLLD